MPDEDIQDTPIPFGLKDGWLLDLDWVPESTKQDEREHLARVEAEAEADRLDRFDAASGHVNPFTAADKGHSLSEMLAKAEWQGKMEDIKAKKVQEAWDNPRDRIEVPPSKEQIASDEARKRVDAKAEAARLRAASEAAYQKNESNRRLREARGTSQDPEAYQDDE